MQINSSNIISNSRVFTKVATFYHNLKRPIEPKENKVRHYSFDGSCEKPETVLSLARNAIIQEQTKHICHGGKAKVLTFDIRYLQILLNNGHTHLIVTKHAITLSDEPPFFERIMPSGRKFIDKISLTFPKKPVVCSHSQIFDATLAKVWIVQTGQCPCQILSINPTSSEMFETNLTVLNEKEFNDDKDSYLEENHRIFYYVKNERNLKKENQELRKENSGLRKKDSAKEKKISGLEKKISGLENNLSATQKERNDLKDQKYLYQLAQYSRPGSKLSYVEGYIGTGEFLFESTAEIITLTPEVAPQILEIASGVVEAIPVVAAASSLIVCGSRIYFYVSTGETKQLHYAAGDVISAGLSLAHFGTLKLFAKGISYVTNLAPSVVNFVTAYADGTAKHLELQNNAERKHALNLPTDKPLDLIEIRGSYNILKTKLKEPQFQENLKSIGIDPSNFHKNIRLAQDALIKERIQILSLKIINCPNEARLLLCLPEAVYLDNMTIERAKQKILADLITDSYQKDLKKYGINEETLLNNIETSVTLLIVQWAYNSVNGHKGASQLLGLTGDKVHYTEEVTDAYNAYMHRLTHEANFIPTLQDHLKRIELDFPGFSSVEEYIRNLENTKDKLIHRWCCLVTSKDRLTFKDARDILQLPIDKELSLEQIQLAKEELDLKLSQSDSFHNILEQNRISIKDVQIKIDQAFDILLIDKQTSKRSVIMPLEITSASI